MTYGTRVFVGGINGDVSKDNIEREFGKFGKLSNVWVAQNPPGFAFVTFEDNRDAEEACKSLNGSSVFDNNKIRVELSRERQGGGRGRGGFRGGRGGDREGGGRGGGGYRDGGGYGGGRGGGFGGGGRGGYDRGERGSYGDRSSGGGGGGGGYSGDRGNDRYGDRTYTRGGGGGARYGGGSGGGGGSRDYEGGSNYRSRSPIGGGRRYTNLNQISSFKHLLATFCRPMITNYHLSSPCLIKLLSYSANVAIS